MQGDAEQRTRADNVILRRVFAKIFERGQRSGHLLHLVEDQQGLIGINLSSRVQLQPHHQALRIQIGSEQLRHSGIGIKIDIYGIRICLPAKFLHQPCLADLTRALDNQRLAVLALLPSEQRFNGRSIHTRHLRYHASLLA